MTDSLDGTALLGRRRALQLLGVGLTAGGLLGLPGCKEGAGSQSTELSGGSAAPAAAPRPPAQVAPPPVETAPAPAAQPPPQAAQPPPAQAAPPPAEAPAPAQAAPAPTQGGLSCKTAAPIDEASQSLRRALQYHEAGTTPEKRCRLCAQFEAGKYGPCGGCKLFTGAVNPEGVCLSFAPRAKPT